MSEIATAPAAGAAPAADVPAESSPAPSKITTTVQRTASRLQRMKERLSKDRTPVEAVAPAEIADATPDTPGTSEAEKKPEVETAPSTAGKDSEKEPEEKTEPETIPMAAFKERLARANQKAERLQDQLNEIRLRESSAQEAIRLMQSEVERYRAALEEKQLLDPRDEEIRTLKLTAEAKDASERLKREHAEQLSKLREEAQEAAQKEIEEAQITAFRERVGAQISSALTEFPLAGRAEVIAQLKRAPTSDPRAVAQAIHERVLAEATRLHAAKAPKPAAPQTVSTPSAPVGRRLPPTLNNMVATLQARRLGR